MRSDEFDPIKFEPGAPQDMAHKFAADIRYKGSWIAVCLDCGQTCGQSTREPASDWTKYIACPVCGKSGHTVVQFDPPTDQPGEAGE